MPFIRNLGRFLTYFLHEMWPFITEMCLKSGREVAHLLEIVSENVPKNVP